MSWKEIKLYTVNDDVNDLADLEPVLAASATDDDHDRVKTILTNDLRKRLCHLQERGKNQHGEGFDILEYIENPEVLKLPAVYLALKTYFRRKSVGFDTCNKRAIMYGNLYPQALDTAVRRIRWDVKMAKKKP